MKIAFTRVEELVASLAALASLLDRELDVFAERFETRADAAPAEDRQDIMAMFQELERLEKANVRTQAFKVTPVLMHETRG